MRLKLFGFAGVRMLRYNTTTIYGADSLLGLADSLLETIFIYLVFVRVIVCRNYIIPWCEL